MSAFCGDAVVMTDKVERKRRLGEDSRRSNALAGHVNMFMVADPLRIGVRLR